MQEKDPDVYTLLIYLNWKGLSRQTACRAKTVGQTPLWWVRPCPDKPVRPRAGLPARERGLIFRRCLPLLRKCPDIKTGGRPLPAAPQQATVPAEICQTGGTAPAVRYPRRRSRLPAQPRKECVFPAGYGRAEAGGSVLQKRVPRGRPG